MKAAAPAITELGTIVALMKTSIISSLGILNKNDKFILNNDYIHQIQSGLDYLHQFSTLYA